MLDFINRDKVFVTHTRWNNIRRKKTLTGADAMVKCLEAEGINLVFGYPGVAIAPFYEGLYNSGIEHVLVRQEQNAGHAASGYARMSRKPAVCVILYSQSCEEADNGDSFVILHHFFTDRVPAGIPLRHLQQAVCRQRRYRRF